MKTFYILENSNSPHEEGIITLIEVLKYKGCKVVLCLNQLSEQRMRKFANINLVDEIVRIDSIKELVLLPAKINNAGILLHNTVSVRNSFTTVFLGCLVRNNVYYIRNANSWLFFSNHEGAFYYRVLRYISTALKKFLLKRAQYLIVESDQIKNYLSKYTSMRIEIIPYKYYTTVTNKNSSTQNVISFVVPGAVDLERKPLDVVIAALRNLPNQYLKKIKIILLGRPLGETARKLCDEWMKEFGDSLEYFNGFVENEVFEKTVNDATYILCSFKLKHQDRYLDEVYGETKGSGVFGQAISYGKPLIVNKGFKVPSEIESSTLYFEDASELCNIFKEAVANEANRSILISNAYKNSSSFTIENIANSLNLSTR